MNLNPQDRTEWNGFLDLLQPPPGYRLKAAVGTSFGLSIEALVAALLAMCDADGEELARDPVAATIAITRLAKRVRVLVHPATIAGSPANGAQGTFVRLLDRLLIEVQPDRGLFHPKIWALQFEHVGAPNRGKPAEFGRLLVGSRNIVQSNAFELGAVFETTPDPGKGDSLELGRDVERALYEWLKLGKAQYPTVISKLPKFFGQQCFEVPPEASSRLRLRWQGNGRPPLLNELPTRLRRAVVLSPFVQPDFLEELLARTERLEVVSLPESLDALPDDTYQRIRMREKQQGTAVLYQVSHHEGPDEAVIAGIHAKLFLAEDAKGRQVTFVGSANATRPGWGLDAGSNVEAMIEMRPGLDLDRFVKAFIRDKRTKVHPWVDEYARDGVVVTDPQQVAERELLAAIREVARIGLALRYDTARRTLAVTAAASPRSLPPWVMEGKTYDIVPMGLLGRAGTWRSLADLDAGLVAYQEVDLSQVSAFVVIRGQSTQLPVHCQRLVLAHFEAHQELWADRDQAITSEILATVDPAVVLRALVRGVAHVGNVEGLREAAVRARGTLARLLEEVSLERLLQAVALDRTLVHEIRMLLAPIHGQEVLTLCDDLEAALNKTYGRATA